MTVLTHLTDLFFALNRTNYARWGSLYLEKLSQLGSAAMDVLQAGAFSTRRKNKAYSRSTIDLTFEQTTNRNAASAAAGVVHFTNSEKAFRRWCVSLPQRSMAVRDERNVRYSEGRNTGNPIAQAACEGQIKCRPSQADVH